MPTVFLAPGPFGAGYQGFSNTGAPLSGGLINTYAAGTTTPTSTYNSSSGTVANANPLVLDSAGRITSEVWIPAGQAIKFAVVDSVSNLIQTYDNINGINDPASINGIGYTGATISGALIMNQAPINEAQGPNVPVAAAINLTSTNGNYLWLTGAGTITSLQIPVGAYREFIVATATCAFVNSNSLPMIGQASITASGFDIVGFRGEAGGISRNVLYQKINGTALTNTSAPLTRVSQILAANVLLNNIGAYFDGPSISVGALGIWYVSGTVTCQDTSAAVAAFNTKLWDGTNIISTARSTAFSANNSVSITLTGFIINQIGPIKISVNDPSSTAGVIQFNASGNSNDCQIWAMRVA